MYTILEQQTTKDGATAYPPLEQKATRNEAESVYHSKLAYAATSSVYVHAVSLLTDDGRLVDSKCYVHNDEEVE